MGKQSGFGTRYGRTIRLQHASVARKKNYLCPSCKKEGVKRIASGIWHCTKCSHKFAGKAYQP